MEVSRETSGRVAPTMSVMIFESYLNPNPVLNPPKRRLQFSLHLSDLSFFSFVTSKCGGHTRLRCTESLFS